MHVPADRPRHRPVPPQRVRAGARLLVAALGCFLAGCSGGGGSGATPLVVTPSTTGVNTLGVATISVSGGLAPYVVALTANGSGGQVLFDGQTVTYTAGSVGGIGAIAVTDVIDVTDADGSSATVSFTVDSTAFAGFVERYGTTDNWMLNFDAKRFAGAHPYDTDLHSELVRLGLRSVAGTGAGPEHDQLAASYVMLRIMHHVSLFYLNDGDGTPSSLDISIFAETPATGSAPAAGTSLAGGPDLFNVVEFSTQTDDSVLGRSFLDAGNGAIEHNGGDVFGSELGVDITDCTDFYLGNHPANVLAPAVDATDEAGLLSLINGNPPAGPREQEIADLVDHYAYRIALVTAHEIGHSLGHDHNGTSGSVMFASFNFGDGISPAFLAAEVTAMQTDLPGPGRGGAPGMGGPGAWAGHVDGPFTRIVGANGGVVCSCGEPVWQPAGR